MESRFFFRGCGAEKRLSRDAPPFRKRWGGPSGIHSDPDLAAALVEARGRRGKPRRHACSIRPRRMGGAKGRCTWRISIIGAIDLPGFLLLNTSPRERMLGFMLLFVLPPAVTDVFVQIARCGRFPLSTKARWAIERGD